MPGPNWISFGIILDDIVFPDGSSQMGVLGGGGAQTAWGMAAALGSGERVGLVAGLGDELPSQALGPLQAAGINLEGLRHTGYPTPRAWQVTEADGRRTQIWRTPPAQLGEQLAKKWDLLPSSYQAAQFFHWGLHAEDGIPHLAHDLYLRDKVVSLELFRSPAGPLVSADRQAIYRLCQVFSATEAEIRAMIGEEDWRGEARKFADLGGRYWIVRQGERGATLIDCQAKRQYRVPAIPVQVRDEVGAGNCFCGAFLAHYNSGAGEALCQAVTAASYMIEQVGLPHQLPSAEDYQARLNYARQGLESLEV
jgi:sugar/nucleoside kinase (ribokinase family)